MASSTEHETDIGNLHAYINLIGAFVSQSLSRVVTESIAFGVYTALFAFTMAVTIRSRSPLRSRKATLLAVLFTMYALAVVHLGLSLSQLFEDDKRSTVMRELALTCAANSDGAMGTERCAAVPRGYDVAAGAQLTWVSSAPVTVNSILGDVVVLWRAWALWPRSRIVKIVSVLLIVSCTAMSTWNTVAKYTFRIYDSSPATLPSWFANLWATALIGSRAWQHRRHVLVHLHSSFRSSTERVLLLLVESGVLYCLFGALFTLPSIVNFLADFVPALRAFEATPFSRALYVIEAGPLIDILGMYPTAVILLMELSNHYAHRALSANDMPTLPLPCPAGPARTCAPPWAPVVEGTAPCDPAGENLHLRLSEAVSSSATFVEPAETAGELDAEKPRDLDTLPAVQ
ncbi:hypothetical protein PsYK624_033040 [Phanerochaete sordida]|uniref:Uncharacterized protein n=1 Tax=Phanerochaete sordida TaxID=48140 RepID=A0A9P3L9F8_9APHY|nr:hypothetical protein PsYK624_033040 [Phanerochaete sordida]